MDGGLLKEQKEETSINFFWRWCLIEWRKLLWT
jgi:hypothetical protein